MSASAFTVPVVIHPNGETYDVMVGTDELGWVSKDNVTRERLPRVVGRLTEAWVRSYIEEEEEEEDKMDPLHKAMGELKERVKGE